MMVVECSSKNKLGDNKKYQLCKSKNKENKKPNFIKIFLLINLYFYQLYYCFVPWFCVDFHFF